MGKSIFQQATEIQQSIKSDKLIPKQNIVIEVCDADDYIIAEINVTNRHIHFNTGYAAKCRELPSIKRLLDKGYDSNGGTANDNVYSIKHIENTSDTLSRYKPMRTAEDVIQNYVFKGSAGEPINHTNPRFAEMMYEFAYENICGKSTDDADILHVGDVSRPDYHPQWFMVRDEFRKLKDKPE